MTIGTSPLQSDIDKLNNHLAKLAKQQRELEQNGRSAAEALMKVEGKLSELTSALCNGTRLSPVGAKEALNGLEKAVEFMNRVYGKLNYGHRCPAPSSHFGPPCTSIVHVTDFTSTKRDVLTMSAEISASRNDLETVVENMSDQKSKDMDAFRIKADGLLQRMSKLAKWLEDYAVCLDRAQASYEKAQERAILQAKKIGNLV